MDAPPRAADWPDDEPDRASSTSTDPRVLTAPEARFAIGLRVPCRYGTDEHGVHLTDGQSSASVRYEPEGSVFRVRQGGPRDLWEEVQAAYHWWTEHGKPGFTRFGATVEDGRQWAWLDDPAHAWPL
ncbi:hypothetical protein ACFQ2B_16395 [Streptomyces stramineus]